MHEEIKVKAVNAWNDLMLTMGRKFDLPTGFAIEVSPTLREWFESGDPEKVQKFIDWVVRTKADLT